MRRYLLALATLAALLGGIAIVVGLLHSTDAPMFVAGSARFAGEIADRQGRALSGAHISATWIGADDAPRTIGGALADAHGRYELGVSPPAGDQGVLVLRASAPGFGDVGRRVVVSEQRQDFRLIRGTARLVVRVISEDGEALPAADVVVSIEPVVGEPDALLVHHGRTAADGSWIIEDVSATGAEVHWIASAPGRGRTFGTTPKPEGDATVEIIARLEAGAELIGEVVDRDGHAVASAAVVAREAEGPWRETATSDGSGYFRVTGVPRATDLPVELAGDWILAGESEQTVVRLAPGERTRTLRLVAEPAGVIAGRVVSASGSALAGATVSATPSDHVLTRTKAIATVADGTFELRGLRVGTTWNLEVRHPRFAPTFADKVATPARGLSLELRAGGALVGGVDDDRYWPHPGIEVYAHRIDKGSGVNVVGLREYATVKTGVDGSFRIEHLSAGTYRVEYRSSAHMAWSPTAAQLSEAAIGEGHDTVLPRIAIARGASLRVAVFTDDRAPARLHRMKVSILPSARGGAPQRTDVRTGSEGSFVIDNLVAGIYQVAVHSDDHGFVHRREVKLEAGTTSTVEVTFPTASELAGVIVDSDGQPVPGALVDVFSADAGDQAGYPLPGRAPDNFSGNFTRSDDGGHFRITGLVPGAYRLRIASARSVPVSMEVRAPAPRDPLAVRLPRPATISVRVIGVQPRSGSTVLVESHDGAGFSGSRATDAAGNVTFASLPAGEYTVRAVREQIDEHSEVAGGGIEERRAAPGGGIEEQHVVVHAGDHKAVQFGG